MLHVVTLVLVLAFPSFAKAPEGEQEALTLKGDLKDVPAQGKDGPSLLCEGTTNLPNGSALLAHLYYGKPVSGKEIFKNTILVKNGKFLQDFQLFPKRNFPGSYIARLTYDPDLQGLGAPDYPRTSVDFPLQLGNAQDVDAAGKAVRDQLIGELRALIAIADQMKAKLDDLKDKPQAEREVPVKAWHEESIEIRKRILPRRNPEYFLLKLDMIADSGFEDLSNILLAAARCFVLNQRDNTLEGLARLRQTAEYWIGEISTPRVADFTQMVAHIEECRTITRKLLDKPDEPVQPVRRRFLELTAILDKSIPGDFHEVILGATSRAAAFFNGVSDKSANIKELHADLDSLLERFAGTLRTYK